MSQSRKRTKKARQREINLDIEKFTKYLNSLMTGEYADIDEIVDLCADVKPGKSRHRRHKRMKCCPFCLLIHRLEKWCRHKEEEKRLKSRRKHRR